MNRIGIGLLLVVAFTLGCGDNVRITSYRAPKIKQRMLAAIVTQGKTAWFFKMTGPIDLVAKQAQPFDSFVGSLEFSPGAESEPTWKLPKGWSKVEESRSMRFATLKIEEGDLPLELTVIPLPISMADVEEYNLRNVNRWRDQLQLEPLSLQAMKDATQKVRYKGGEALVFNFVGVLSESGSRPPFAAGGAASPRPMSSGQSSPPPTFEVPSGWERAPGTQFSIAAFAVRKGDDRVDITITPAFGPLLANVNRWRAQIGLSQISDGELADAKKSIEIDSAAADYFELVGAEETILGVVAQRLEGTWFIKLRGPKSLAAAEKERFETFVRSLKFPSR